MIRTACKLVVGFSALILTCSAFAQSTKTEHTFKLDDPDARPAATLADVAWMVGSFTGEGFGGTIEEVWNPPSLGTMVGMFKFMGDDAVGFYEIMLLAEEEGSLVLKVKHFNPDFTAWEEKDDYIKFRLISAEEGVAHFSGLSFYRVNENEIDVYIAMHNGDKVWEEKLAYRRVKPL